MTFADDLKRFATKVEARNQAVFVGTVADAKTSIVEGSAVTGAPGQPVLTSNLRNSWQVEFDTPTSAIISTNVVYAPENEYGIRQKDGGPYVQRSSVGGRHSVSLTIAGFGRIVESVTKRLTAGEP